MKHAKMKHAGGKLAPGPRPPLAKMLLGKGKAQEQLGFLLSAARDYGPVVGLRYLNRSSVLLDAAEPIERVLRTNCERAPSPRRGAHSGERRRT